jgi:tetratricopeptide (TPR) repeat protein
VSAYTGFEDLRLDSDPVTLREVVPDPPALQLILEAVRANLQATGAENRSELSRLHGQECVLLRLLGDLEGALVAGRLSLRYSGDDPALVTVAGVRLAHIHQWRGEYQVADGIYTQALEGAPDGYRSFACQHAGKSRYEQGDADAAIGHFENAVRLRVSGPADLLAAAQQALEAARRLKNDVDLSGL